MENKSQQGEKMDPIIDPESPSKQNTAATPTASVGGFVGRMKAPPVCKAELKKQSQSCEELSKLCFSIKEAALLGSVPSLPQTSPTNEPQKNIHSKQSSHKETEESMKIMSMNAPLDQPWDTVRRQILNFQTSRNGRECQRFAGDAQGQFYRLTTGTVPIMSDGRILLCSSSRKESWILPKGGWESDESLELSALRETFEEAGVLGFLGPELNVVEYETRKGKKRRLEMNLKKKKEARKSGAVSVVSTSSSCGVSSDDEHTVGKSNLSAKTNKESTDPNNNNHNHNNSSSGATSPSSGLGGNANMNVERFDDSASVASIASVSSDVSSSCTHCRLHMIPLFVTEVKEHWPESGRGRKVVHIDEAIEIMSSRPEFQTVLYEVKRKGFHKTETATEGNRISLGSTDDSIGQNRLNQK